MTNSGLTRELYLGIDQCGSSTKALLLDQNGQVQWQDSQQIRTITEADLAKNSCVPESFIFEHDAVEIVESVKSLIDKAKAVAGQKIKGLGLSIQRSGVLAWRAEAKQLVPLTHVRSWRDARNQELIEQYQLEASVNCCGAILQEVQNIESAHGGAVNYSSLEGLKEVLFWSPISSGSPDWITGLPLINEGIVPGTLLYARALLDNLAFWINQNLVCLTECGIIKNQSIYALGGGSQNNYLMQALSNLSGFKIIRLKSSQGSAFGAAAAAYASVNGALLNLNGAGFDEFLPRASDIKFKWERWKKIYQSVKIRKS